MDQREELTDGQESAAAKPYNKCKNCGYPIKKDAWGVWAHLTWGNILCQETRAEPLNPKAVHLSHGVYVAPSNEWLEIYTSGADRPDSIIYLYPEVEKELLSYLQARASAE